MLALLFLVAGLTASAAPLSSASSASSSTSSASSTSSSAVASTSATAKWTPPSGWAVASTPCIAEGTSGRALTWGKSMTSSSMTIETCLAYCDSLGVPLAGLEYSGECYCGGVLTNGASLSIASSACSMPCSGAASEICGGPGALSLFVSTSASGLSADYTSAAVTLPTGWQSYGCLAEGKTGRALDGWSYTSPALNVATCLSYCKAKGFMLAGLENGNECWCDSYLRNGAGASSTACTTPCSGGPGQNCGGPNALQVYSNVALSTTATTSQNGYLNQGCYQEVAGRALTGASYSSDGMTVDTCTAYCKAGGFRYAGVEYGRECYCGYQFSNGASWDKYSGQCNMKCAGNTKQVCGGPNALVVYSSS